MSKENNVKKLMASMTNGSVAPAPKSLFGKVDQEPVSLWAVFDAGGQGEEYNGIIAVFENEKLAKEFVGDKWLNIVPFKLNAHYPSGIEYTK